MFFVGSPTWVTITMLQLRWLLPVLATAAVGALSEDRTAQDSSMMVGWASTSKGSGDGSALDVADMVCFPAKEACSGPRVPDTVVHSIVKIDKEVSSRTTLNSVAYPSTSVPAEYQLGACRGTTRRDGEESKWSTKRKYEPVKETFSMTFVAAGTGPYTEVGGPAFTSQTTLKRRSNLRIGGADGIVATHDTFALSDNWNLEGQKTPWGITYSGPTRFFQQFYMFNTGITLDFGQAKISVSPCDMLHLFHFVREDGNDEVATSADWKFRREGKTGFSQKEFVQTGAVALRQVDGTTIAIEVEKDHFLGSTGASADRVTLPEFTSADGKTFVRMYEWKSTVFCSRNTADAGALANLTAVNATFSAAFETFVPPAEAKKRSLRGWTYTEPPSGDRAAYTLNFWYIPADGQPLIYKTDPNGHDFDHIHLNLKWTNLPPVAECPVLVWDPTFHALPASPDQAASADAQGLASVGSCNKLSIAVMVMASVVLTIGGCGCSLL